MMWSQAEDKEFWLNWLGRYKELRCLWDEDEKRSAGRQARNKAYQELVDLAKNINPEADHVFVRSRISTFRTGYRRELKKKQAAQTNGIDYEPQLFYYKLLDEFLNDTAEYFDAKDISESMDNNDSIRDSPDILEEAYNISRMPLPPSEKKEAFKNLLDDCLSEEMTKRTKSYKRVGVAPRNVVKNPEKRSISHIETDVVKSEFDDYDAENAMDNFEMERSEPECNDEYDILGKRIAAHIRNMSRGQRLMAEKIITDVCICGRLEKLTMSSVLCVTKDQIGSLERDDEVSYDDDTN